MFKHFFKALSVAVAILLLIIPHHSKSDSSVKTELSSLTDITPKSSNSIRILSYNLLSDGPGFYGSPCRTRLQGIDQVINSLNPHIIGLQECDRRWFYNLNNTEAFTPCYAFIDPIPTELFGYMTTIVYNKQKVILIKSGSLMLPESYDYRTRRAAYGVFRLRKGGDIFCVINTHLSLSVKSNLPPIRQGLYINELTARLRSIYNCPIFVIGDFNAKERGRVQYPSSQVYDILTSHLTDTKSSAKLLLQGDRKSVNSANNDHIFLSGDANILCYGILSCSPLDDLSDHYPIFADFTLY